MNDFLPAAVGALIRAGLQIVAGMGVAVAPTLEGQLTAGAIGLATILWSLYQKKKTV